MSWLCIPVVLATLSSFITPTSALKSRVFGGRDLRHDVHKYLVSLVIEMSYYEGHCSGSIIDQRWIITSAHCFDEPAHAIRVLHFIKNQMKVIAEIAPKDVKVHPKYFVGEEIYDNTLHDLALLKTKKPIKFDNHVRPIRLANSPPQDLQSAIIAGYGEAEPNKSRPREGAVVIKKCNSRYICTVDIARAGDGDSGGALVSKGYLVAVTSASCIDVHISKPCITLYSEVYASSSWIKEIMSS